MPHRFSPERNTHAPDDARANVMRSPLASGSGSRVNFSPPPSAGSWRAQSTSFSAVCEASSTPMSQSPRQQSPRLWHVKTTSSARRSPCAILAESSAFRLYSSAVTTRSGTLVATAKHVVAVVTLLIAAALPMVVYADTLDPTWMGGFWDDDDFDSVILLVTNLKASLPTAVPVFEATTHAVDIVSVVATDAPFTERRPAFNRRGPPLA